MEGRREQDDIGREDGFYYTFSGFRERRFRLKVRSMAAPPLCASTLFGQPRDTHPSAEWSRLQKPTRGVRPRAPTATDSSAMRTRLCHADSQQLERILS